MENISKLFKKYPIPSDTLSVISEQLLYAKDSKEHPIYHPEKYLINHIDIVVGRALESDNSVLHFTALFHDITKSGRCPLLWEGFRGENKIIESGEYFQNIHHAEQAGDFILLPIITKWLKYYEIDLFAVHSLVINHMKMKNYIKGENNVKGGMGLSKREKFKKMLGVNFTLLKHFSEYCDNMLITTQRL